MNLTQLTGVTLSLSSCTLAIGVGVIWGHLTGHVGMWLR
jgi:hypothetical protein